MNSSRTSRPPICLTGDLHHTSLQTGNQQHSDITELQTAQRYLAMLAEANVKVTFFISGKCFAEEWNDTRVLCESPLVEVGGHNWDCFEPVLFHRISKKLLNSYNGPSWYQRRDCRKTMNIIRQKTGRTIRVWRNHMYMHGCFTESVLASCGIAVCSDSVKKNGNGLEWHEAGIYNFPINIIPDHEHLYHAERTPEWVDWWVKRYRWSDEFGSESYYIEEWVEKVLEGLHQNEECGVVSNLIIHPITMYLCDRFRGFEKILDFLAERETIWVGEYHDRVVGAGSASRQLAETTAGGAR
ncbi:MAG: hypothetical protein OHK0029_12450 [Armatimonadaceae bacterium]